ncbi:MAG: hypothetical protein PVI30_13045 [Myxococcales bacterium]|jgi:hypothetical protein
MRRCLPLLVLLSAMGCATTAPAARPNGALTLRGEAGLVYADPDPAALATAAVGFSTGSVCCAVGAFASGLGVQGDEARNRRMDVILGAGLEAMTMAPFIWDRLGFQLRIGTAGTRPDSPRLGRRGYTGSGALVVRLSHPAPPQTSTWDSLMELALGVNWWSLGAERSSAGRAPTPNDEAQDRLGLMLTFRVGARYGVDLK